MNREVEMATPEEDKGRGYDSLYEEFDLPLQQQLRREAYGEDIGQHSWVTADELREIVSALNLSSDSRLWTSAAVLQGRSASWRTGWDVAVTGWT